MKPRKNRFIITAASALLFAPAAFALDGTWNVAGGGSWNTPGNWLSGTAGGVGYTANFTGLNITADATVTLDGARTIGNLVFSDTDTSSTGSWIIASGSGGSLTLDAGLLSPTITVNALGSGKFAQINAVLAGNNGFTKTGAGALLLNNSGNTISGHVVLSQGNIQLNAAGLTNASSVAINGGTLVVATTAANAIGGTISFGGGTLQYNSTPGTDYSAQFSTAANQQYKINVGGTNTVILASNLASAGGTLTKASTGTLTLSAANTFTGITTVSGGNLVLNNSLALQNSAIDTVNSIAGTASVGLGAGVTSLTFGGLTGTGTQKALATLFNTSTGNYGTVANVTLNPGTGATYSYSGVIANGATGMTLTKTGAGTQTLSGVNTYTGSTILSGGVLNYGNASALSNGSISFNGNATLQAGVAATMTNAVSVANDITGTVDTNNLATTLSGAITGTGNLTKSGLGNLTLTGGTSNTLSGVININTGRLVSTDGTSFANMTGAVTVASGAGFDFSKNITGNNLTNALNLSGTGTSTNLGALNIYGNATASGAITLGADTTITHSFNNAYITNSITGADRNLTLKTTQSAQPGLTVSAVISLGTGGITITGAGGTNIVTLSVANSYSGGTNITAGTLNFANASALGSGTVSFTGNSTLQAGGAYTLANAVSVANGITGTLDTNGNATTLGGALTGSGNLTKIGTGTLTLTGGTGNTLSGAINVNAGTLASTNGTSLKNTAGTITVASGASLNFSQNFTTNNLTNALNLSGAGTGGLGALHLDYNATASGAITLDADTTISHAWNTSTISGSITAADRNLTLTKTQAAQTGITVSGTVNLGTGGITVTGAADSGTYTVRLTGDNSYSGGTLVSSGSLLVSNTTGSGTGSGAVTVNNGATLGGTGTISGAVNVSGVLSPGASIESLGTGALTLMNDSNLKYEMNTATVGGDLLHVTGALNIGANVTLDLTDLAALSQALAVDTKFTLLSYSGVWNNGIFNGHADDSTFLFANNEWRINYNDLTGGSNFTSDQTGATRFVTLTVIPEPSALGLLGLGGMGALLVRRRRAN